MDCHIEEMDPAYMEYALKRSLISRNKLAIILKDQEGNKQYCCVECAARYDTKEELEVHLCSHTKEYRFLCGICGTGLKRKEHLDRHLLEHQQVRPHVCLICGKAFKRKEHLTIHTSIHKGDKTQMCPLCNRSFHRKDHLQKHLQTHSKTFVEQNVYGVEEDIMDIKQELIDEDAADVSGSESMEYEAECPDSVDSSDYVDSTASESLDVKTPDATGERPFVCLVCHKSYKRKDHLKIHSWSHMKKDKVCSGCGKAFHKEVQLATHMQVCIQVHLKQYKGDQPSEDEGFSNLRETMQNDQSLLVERLVVPIEPMLRPHECVVCHRRFKRKQHLKVHANVHLKTPQPSIWCPECNEGFLTNEQFESHPCPGQYYMQMDEQQPAAPLEAKKENDNPSQFLEQELIVPESEMCLPVPQRVYVCKYCGKPFKRKDHYKIHLHIHTGVKSFFCQECGKGFYRKDHLQKHGQTHSKPKPIPKPVNLKPKKRLPDLVPISQVPISQLPRNPPPKPEITIHAPTNSKLRVPLQIKVPYQMVMSGKTVTVDPRFELPPHEIFG